jgi:hypothetical protein
MSSLEECGSSEDKPPSEMLIRTFLGSFISMTMKLVRHHIDTASGYVKHLAQPNPSMASYFGNRIQVQLEHQKYGISHVSSHPENQVNWQHRGPLPHVVPSYHGLRLYRLSPKGSIQP